MRSQLSLEFLLYIGIAMASMAAMLALYLKGSAQLRQYSAQAELEAFVTDVNANMGMDTGSFYAYLPKGICAAQAINNSITYMNVSYQFYGNVSLQLGGACNSGRIVLVRTSVMRNGTLLVS